MLGFGFFIGKFSREIVWFLSLDGLELNVVCVYFTLFVFFKGRMEFVS